MEVKSGEGTVVVADRNRYSDECCNNRGWGSGWGAVGGALVGGGFGAAAVSVWDKINDTKADIQKVESTVQEAKAGIYKDISDAARGVTSEVAGVSRQVEGVGKEVLNNRLVIRLILISGILVIKWEQGSIGLWIVFARWNINSQIAAVKLRA